MNRCTNSTIATDSDRSSQYILKSVVDAMLDCLTVEQQTKMASYLQRAARQQNAAQQRAEARTKTTLVRIC